MEVDLGQQVDYINQHLIPKILKTLGEPTLISSKVIKDDKLDGFMSTIYKIEMETVTADKQTTVTHKLIAKLVKGDNEFRISSKANIQFRNEIYIYTDVITSYERFLSGHNGKIRIDNWIPKVYYGFCGNIPELGHTFESILVLENLQPKGYRGGPRLELDEAHLRLMIKLISEYHAMCYALKITDRKRFNALVDGMTPLPYTPAAGEKNIYTVLYGVGFDRFFQYADKVEATASETLIRDTNNLKHKYGDNPVVLMENFRRADETFSVILHGDYNRNNVLFQYDSCEGYDNPKDIKMIDFQETWYGTPAMDLTFFMFMNMNPVNYAELWDKLLNYYHDCLMQSLCDVLQCAPSDARLQPYSFDNFIKHFSKYAFYGAMICIHFIPWMICSTEECAQISKLFETNVHGKEFYDVSLIIGGDEANDRVYKIVNHASSKGYMKDL